MHNFFKKNCGSNYYSVPTYSTYYYSISRFSSSKPQCYSAPAVGHRENVPERNFSLKLSPRTTILTNQKKGETRGGGRTPFSTLDTVPYQPGRQPRHPSHRVASHAPGDPTNCMPSDPPEYNYIVSKYGLDLTVTHVND